MEKKDQQLEPNPRNLSSTEENDKIFLSIKIGNGQIGGNNVKQNGTLLAKGNLSEPTQIGKASDLADNEIHVETNVLDVNGFTNKCVITTTFTNQDNKTLFTKIDDGDAPENGVISFKGTYLVRIFMLILLNSIGLVAFGQNELEYNDLETPSSPGFILFDETPSAIEKPTTPQGLGLSLLGIQQNGGAIEFAPFWLTSHPNLDAKEFASTKVPIIEHALISLASTNSDTSRNLSVGIRTRLFQSFNSELNKIEAQITAELSKSADQIDLIKLEKLRKQYVELSEKRIFTIDIAGAYGALSETGSFEELEFARSAIWLSVNWRPKADDFYVTALGRLRNHELETGSEDLLDLGGRLNYDFSQFSLSMEYLQRINFTTDESDDFRLAAIASYKLSKNIYLTSTFGKNFSEVNNIIALAGVNIGYSNSKVNAF